MLTKKQQKLLLFIHGYIQKNGICPTFDEMATGIDQGSKSGIHSLITALVERGFIRRIPNRARAIDVIKLPANAAETAFCGFKIVSNPNVPDGEVWVHAGNRMHKFLVSA